MAYELRQAAARRDQLTLRRFDELLPRLMDEHGIDCWVVASREYADDAIAMTMIPADWFSTRRRTILVFHRTEAGLDRLSVARYDMGDLFETAWDPSEEPDQWKALALLLADRDPVSIAVNTSTDFAHADGLTHTEHEALTSALGHLADRVVSADPLSVAWLETRIPAERPVLEEACRRAHQLLRRGLSREAVTPGLTTTLDLTWWYRQAIQELGTVTWFQPTVSIQRAAGDGRGSFAAKPQVEVIEPGDLIHVDFGIVWGGLNTDQQEHAYVLRPGETKAPSWIDEALAAGNKAQDILTSQFVVGRTGNEILAAALEPLDPVIYTHPIGYQGHGAGPTIGLWDHQEGVPGSGDRPMAADTAWSIELMVRYPSAPWEQTVSIMLEQDAWFDGTLVYYLDGRQTELWTISP
jgi:Xaa-Pro aminopeptidase